MIRVNGKNKETGQRFIVVVLPPDLVKQMRRGQPVAIDLQRGHPDVISASVELFIHAPTKAATAKMAAKIAADAQEQGVKGKVVGKAPRRTM